MKTARTTAELKTLLAGVAREEIGMVPTMGALHEGHLSLVHRSVAECAVTVVTIFVNPTQFNDPEDLRRYPRTPERDLALLETTGADIVFMPDVSEIYPEPDARVFDFGAAGDVMEGATRPGHFNGVGQVVSRLFGIVEPSKAYFGEKDFQQVAIIRRLVKLLDLPVDIVVCPTVRETDGLAMSSRNALLTGPAREAAPAIYAALRKVSTMRGQMDPRKLEAYASRAIDSAAPLKTIYFNIVDASTLAPVEDWNDNCDIQACVAVQAGDVRLIDNISIK